MKYYLILLAAIFSFSVSATVTLGSAAGPGSNASALQGVNISTTAPSDTQVLTYDAATSSWKPATGGGGGGTPAGSSGAVQFNSSGSFGADSSNLFWDDSNNRLGIGTATPAGSISSFLSANAANIIYLNNTGTGALSRSFMSIGENQSAGNMGFGFSNASYDATGIEMFAANSGWLYANTTVDLLTLIAGKTTGAIRFATGGFATANERMRIDSGGLVGIGTASPAFPLDLKAGVDGITLRVQGSGTGGGSIIDLDATLNSSGGRRFKVFSTGSGNGDIGGSKFAIQDAGVAGVAGYRFIINSTGAVQLGGYGAGVLQTDSSGNVTAGGVAAGSTSHVQFNTSGALSGDSKLAWDNTNKLLGVGLTPVYTLDVKPSTDAIAFRIQSGGTGNGATFDMDASAHGGKDYRMFSTGSTNGDIGGSKWGLRDVAVVGVPSYRLVINSAGDVAFSSDDFYWDNTNKRLGLGTATPATRLDVNGTILISSTTGLLDLPETITAGGTTGNQTINKISGTVNIAAAGTTVTVTNSTITANSIVTAIARTDDTTCSVKNAVPAAGSVVINMTAACTAETSVGFVVFN